MYINTNKGGNGIVPIGLFKPNSERKKEDG